MNARELRDEAGKKKVTAGSLRSDAERMKTTIADQEQVGGVADAQKRQMEDLLRQADDLDREAQEYERRAMEQEQEASRIEEQQNQLKSQIDTLEQQKRDLRGGSVGLF